MKSPEFKKTVLRGAIALLALFFAQVPFLAAQSLPLDDKARYEKALEAKVDEVLVKLLGPNQAKVVIQAQMDFTRTEQVDVIKGAGADKTDAGGTGAAGTKDEMFKWQSPGTEGQPFNEYLLPGFPTMNSESEGQSYKKQLLFPASMVRKLTVSVIVNKAMSEADAQNMRKVVSEVLGLDSKRGDEFSIIRTPFAPIWRTILNTPESVALIFKYGMLTIMGMISMGIVGVGFLKLATAMNSMAKAQQSHQITMDVGKGGPGAPGAPGAAGAAAAAGGAGGGAGRLDLNVTERRERHMQVEMEPERLFNVKVEQVDFLVNLMSGEDPANITLVAGHLPEEAKTEFLRMLPADVSAEIMANMAQMRFVDPEVVSSIREEVERQLAGAFGGINVVIDALDRVNLKSKREMIASLEAHHPDIAVKVRRRIFLPDDLLKFSDRDVGILATVVKIEDWAMALFDFQPEFREKLKRQLTDKTWAMLEQTMSSGVPPSDKVERAVETVVNSAMKLISEGRVPNPLKEVSPPVAGAMVPAGAVPPGAPAAAAAGAAPETAAAAAGEPQAPVQPPPQGGKV
ncbi:MAG TPA: FliG C-terminal domain-containing protein [Elusimicrobiales bacterium]|nr:FliG C-terminal domain-containing protein [Elusimicrobiales bacterium]